MTKDLLKINAKSFYWASFFLSKDTYIKCSFLYNFCRTLDDIADNNRTLLYKKEQFNKFKYDFLNKNFDNIIVKNMWKIIKSENISEKVVQDLFDGVEADLVESIQIKSKKSLLTYSYRVAGTVGLMMSKILKVKDKEALKGAIDLGIAMQLTNIARDVIEDEKRNCKYIEANFLSIKDTINVSENFYKKSFDAISAIPLRSRFSVIVARRVYKKIGDYILKKENYENYYKSGKIYVPRVSKIFETFFSILDFIKLLFVNKIKYENDENYLILAQEIDFNERI